MRRNRAWEILVIASLPASVYAVGCANGGSVGTYLGGVTGPEAGTSEDSGGTPDAMYMGIGDGAVSAGYSINAQLRPSAHGLRSSPAPRPSRTIGAPVRRQTQLL